VRDRAANVAVLPKKDWFENGMTLRLEVRNRLDGEGVHNLGVRVDITF